jgi:hypothetical protein
MPLGGIRRYDLLDYLLAGAGHGVLLGLHPGAALLGLGQHFLHAERGREDLRGLVKAHFRQVERKQAGLLQQQVAVEVI